MIIGIIPARFKSKRFHGKLMAPLRGKPLIEHTYFNALKCASLDRLLVATDHSDIHSHISKCGGQALFTSPNCSTGTDRVVEALRKDRSLKEEDIVVIIQGDEPLIESNVIDASVSALNGAQDASVGTAIKEIQEKEAQDPHLVKCVTDINGYALYFSRSPIPGKTVAASASFSYFGHIGIYAYRFDFLLRYPTLKPTPLQQREDLEQLKILEHGYKIKTALVESYSIGVDTPEDLKRVEQLL